MPGAPTGTLQQQIRQQYTYLFQLAQALNRALEQLEVGQTARQQPTQKAGGREEKAATAVGLKSLIVKTAETVSRQVEQMKSELRGEYVAVSDFGTYLEKTSQEIEEDPTKITRYFKFAADIQADVDKVDANFSAYKTDVQGYIRQGIVDYDGVTPIIGIAIGQDIRTTQTGVETEQGVFDVIDKRSNMSVWTTEKLSFYIGGQEAAYFSNGKLTVAQIATNRITGADREERVQTAAGLRGDKAEHGRQQEHRAHGAVPVRQHHGQLQPGRRCILEHKRQKDLLHLQLYQPRVVCIGRTDGGNQPQQRRHQDGNAQRRVVLRYLRRLGPIQPVGERRGDAAHHPPGHHARYRRRDHGGDGAHQPAQSVQWLYAYPALCVRRGGGDHCHRGGHGL